MINLNLKLTFSMIKNKQKTKTKSLILYPEFLEISHVKFYEFFPHSSCFYVIPENDEVT